jgi:hypothetical protein
LFAATACYENPAPPRTLLREYDLKTGTVQDWPAELEESVGPLALADFDGDGDLDLFAGGRVKPGRYPEAATSQIFDQNGQKFRLRGSSTNRFARVGLVSGVVCTDLDGDGDPDLALACEWGPIRVFLNQAGEFTEATAALGLDRFKGFWNGVNAGDFDGDGRLDLVAANWGRNSRHQQFLQKPARLYYGELGHGHAFGVLESYFAPALGKMAPWRTRDVWAKVMPETALRFPTFRQFAEASVEDLAGANLSTLPFVEMQTLDSMVFLNRGARFEPHPLPVEAQFAPAFGIAVADFDGDGHEDLVLAQNFFATDVETARFDAGRGLWLKGDGAGGFQAVPGQASGLLIYGEQRGLAVADYDGDGRVDLAVGQNRERTQLLRNQGARPGVRVRLRGPAGNPAAVGALLRLKFGERFGPGREIHAGAGYLSQDSAVPVLAMPEAPSHIWVRWPGGREASWPFPSGAKEIELDLAAGLKQTK